MRAYQNAKDVLPPPLLAALQQYIQGGYLYVPATGRRPWGSGTNTRALLAARDRQLAALYRQGTSVRALAAQYALSVRAVYRALERAGQPRSGR